MIALWSSICKKLENVVKSAKTRHAILFRLEKFPFAVRLRVSRWVTLCKMASSGDLFRAGVRREVAIVPGLKFAWLILVLIAPSASVAQPATPGSPIVYGRSHVIQSSVLGEPRTINIYLPPNYDSENRRYPVLYVLDGGSAQDFHHISGLSQLGSINGVTQELVVVGIETRDRRRELAFAATDPRYRRQWPSHGHSEDFRQHIAREVIPFIERHWRTSGESALMGESLAGLFVLETLLREPSLFKHYIAIDPSMWWDNGALADLAPNLIRQADSRLTGRILWLATATPQMGTEQLIEHLQRAVPRLTLTLARRPQETHATIYHPAALDALRALYAVPPTPEGPCPWWFCENPAARRPIAASR